MPVALAHAGNASAGISPLSVTSRIWNVNLNDPCAAGEELYFLLELSSAQTLSSTNPTLTTVLSGTQGSMRWYVLHRTAGGAEPAAYQFTFSAAPANASISFFSMTGVTAPEVIGGASTSTGTTATAASIVIPPYSSGILAGFWGGFVTVGSGPSWSTPAGFANINNATFNASNPDYFITAAFKASPSTGATGTVSSTQANGTYNSAVLIFLYEGVSRIFVGSIVLGTHGGVTP